MADLSTARERALLGVVERAARSHGHALILRGGLVMRRYVAPAPRWVDDVDFLGLEGAEATRAMLLAICASPGDDGVRYAVPTIERIWEETEFPGLRARTVATVAGADTREQRERNGTPVDTAAHDAVTREQRERMGMPVGVPVDVRVDVPVDVPVDVRVDVRVDVPVDVRVDVRVDVPVDVRVDVQIDVGFGDPRAVPDPEVAIEGTRTPMRVAAPETLYAWKLHGLFERGEGQWRPKDLFDLLLLGRRRDLDDAGLIECIRLAFSSRGDSLAVADRFLHGDWGQSRSSARKWRSYRRRGNDHAPEDLSPVIDEVRERARPLIEAAR